MNNKQWILSKRPVNKLSTNNFDWVESEVEVIKDGEFLVKNLFLSFDPAQYDWMQETESYVEPIKIGEVMRAVSVAQVIESKHDKFKKGDILQGSFGWQEYAVSDGSQVTCCRLEYRRMFPSQHRLVSLEILA